MVYNVGMSEYSAIAQGLHEMEERLPFRVVETREKGNRVARKVYVAAPQGAVLPLLRGPRVALGEKLTVSFV